MFSLLGGVCAAPMQGSWVQRSGPVVAQTPSAPVRCPLVIGLEAVQAAGFYFDQVVVAAGNTLHTSLMALFPGSVKSDKRTVWVLDELRIYDGGADGDGDTTSDNTVFARPGIFIP